MGIVSTYEFTSDTETVTRTKLNNRVANLLTEFNGSVDNNNIKAAANIAAAKLNLSTIAQNVAFTGTLDFSGATITAQTTFANLVATTADINGGTIDGVTIGATSAPTVTNLGTVTTCDINGGTVDGVTIGGSSAGAITATTLTANTSLALATGATVTGIADEDDMSSNSATLLATQQSIKAYVDSSIGISLTSATALSSTNSGDISLSANKIYLVRYEFTTSGSTDLNLRFNSNSGASSYAWAVRQLTFATSPVETNTGDNADSSIRIANNVNDEISGTFIIDTTKKGTHSAYIGHSSAVVDNAGTFSHQTGAGIFLANVTITDFELWTGFAMTGNVYLYEYKLS